jgi:hypothetical protein
MLEVRVTGKPQVPKNRQSYVHIVTPDLVANNHLKTLLNGTARLSSEAFDLVLTKLEELHPSVVVWKKPKKVILLPAPPLRLPPPPTITPKTKTRTLEGTLVVVMIEGRSGRNLLVGKTNLKYVAPADETETQRRMRVLSQQLVCSPHRPAKLEPMKPNKRYDSGLSTTSGPSVTTSQNATLLDAAQPSNYTRPATVTPASAECGALSSPVPSSAPIIPKPNYTPYTNISTTYTLAQQNTTSNYPRYVTPYNHSPHLETGGYTRDDDCRIGCCTVISGWLFFMAIVGGILYFNGYLV